MTDSNPTTDQQPWATWASALTQRDIAAALVRLRDTVDRTVAAHTPRCEQSGRCCRFESFGHRLYMSGLEIAFVLHQLADMTHGRVDAASDQTSDDIGDAAQAVGSAPAIAGSVSLPVIKPGQANEPIADGCVFQIDGLCSVHALRPIGCRVFHCDTRWSHKQEILYEHVHRSVRQLHDQFDLPYQYMEWRLGLQSARQSGVAFGGGSTRW